MIWNLANLFHRVALLNERMSPQIAKWTEGKNRTNLDEYIDLLDERLNSFQLHLTHRRKAGCWLHDRRQVIWAKGLMSFVK